MRMHCFLAVITAALSMPVLAEGAYLGAEVGRTNLKSTETDGVADPLKANATGFGLYGGYQFQPNAAIEVGYRDLGKIKDSVTIIESGTTATANGTVKLQALHISLLGIFPVSDEFSLYARIGAARLKVKSDFSYTVSGVNETDSDTVKKTHGMFGLGARFAVNKEFGVRAEYTHFSKTEELKISNFTIGGDYQF